MDGLIDVECEESSTFITRFANYLRLLLPCNDVPTMITASKVCVLHLPTMTASLKCGKGRFPV
jgi:hypothetical protein